MPVTFPLTDAEIRERLSAASRDLTPGTREALRQLFGAVFEDAPSDHQQYAREDGAWTVVTAGGGGGNAVLVGVEFGLSFTDKAQTVVTGQSWVLDLSEPTPSNIVGTVVCPGGVDPDEMYLLDFKVVISDLITGVGFTVTVYSQPEAIGTYDVMCIGV